MNGSHVERASAVVLGASGSVGNALVRELIGDGSFGPIVTLARRSQPAQVAMARDAGVELQLQVDHRRADREGDGRDVPTHPRQIGRLPLPRDDGAQSLIAVRASVGARSGAREGYVGAMADAVESFLLTGEFDPQFPDWPGNLAARRAAGTETMRDVLVRVTRWRANRAPLSLGRVPPDAPARIRTRIAPLVEGLFDPDEASTLLSALPERVVVLTPSSFAAQVADLPLRMGWDLANVLLDAVGSPPLGDDAPELDGLCDAGRAFVLPAAIRSEEPFPDVVVHEVAHLLHIVPAREVGLARARGPILAIPPRERETFAYACEVWTGAIRGGLDGTAERALQFASTTSDARANRKTIDGLLGEAAKRPEEGWAILRAWVASLGKRARSKTR